MPEEIIKGIYRIAVPLPQSPLKELNSYFIKGEDRSLLIDTGFRRPECRAALEEGLKALSADMEKTDIFLTHLHSDHAGLAPDLAGGDTRIFISAVDGNGLRSASGVGWSRFDARFIEEGFPKEDLEALVRGNPARSFAPASSDQYEMVEDGQVLKYGGYTLRCVSMPGHTPGQFCLYLPEEKLMFLGDHVLFDITPNITIWPGLENALKVYCDSLRALREYDVEIPLPGHRGVTMTMTERIDQLLGHHQERLEEALSLVERHPGQTAYQLAGQMTWRIRSRSWETFPIAQKWFAVGEALSHLEYLLAGGQIEREKRLDGTYVYHMTKG